LKKLVQAAIEFNREKAAKKKVAASRTNAGKARKKS